ncbi:MAG TPA: glutaredoxin family protein [Burkholderiales bacterium]|nr:glutaredoxin family protein [Burkholderiales bacterium]
MIKAIVAIVFLAVSAGWAAAGELYKWVDKDGKVHYTDQPPGQDVKAQERRKFGDKPGTGPLSYSLQIAVKNFPVTLYNADCADACPKATALLKKRGVPFTDKSARDPVFAEELKALTGGKLLVPVLKVGKQVLTGFEEGAWNTTLDAAGYAKAGTAAARAPATTARAPEPKPVTKPEEDDDDDDPSDDEEAPGK